MPFSLLGLVGRDRSDLQTAIPGTHLIQLPQRFWLLPLTRALLESIAEPAYGGEYPDGFPRFFSHSISD